jgi:hypothetical protein
MHVLECHAFIRLIIKVSADVYLNPMKGHQKAINNRGFTSTSNRYKVKCIH